MTQETPSGDDATQVAVPTGHFAKRIARGAAHLDRVRPAWRNAVDTTRLELSSCCSCVLGQLSGDEFSWNWSHIVESFGIERDTDEDLKLGFALDEEADDEHFGYARLTQEWREYIEATR